MGDHVTSSVVNEVNDTLISKLEASDPLYLHASDSSNLTIVSIKLKGTENYKVWSNAMFLALQVKNKIGFIDGICVKSSTNEILARQWDRCNSIVLTRLLNSVCEDLYLGQVYSKLATELDQILQLPACSCDASKQLNDFNHLIKLMQFLMGLDSGYEYVRTSLLIKEELPTVQDAFAIISREESHRNFANNSVKGQTQGFGFVSKSCQFVENKRIPNRNPNMSFKCTHCTSWIPPTGLSSDQITRLLSLLDNKNSENTQSHNASGANQHMVMTDVDLINQLDVSDLNIRVKHPNGTSALVTKIGNIKLNEKVTLCDVFVVPDYCVNLMSVHKLAKDSKLIVSFNETHCYIQDSLTKSVLVTGSQLDGLYMCGSSSVSDKDSFVCVKWLFKSKKGYKLWSLERKQTLFSRDVKFYENIFPFKDNAGFENNEYHDSNITSLNFFDLYDDDTPKQSIDESIPCDENHNSESFDHRSKQLLVHGMADIQGTSSSSPELGRVQDIGRSNEISDNSEGEIIEHIIPTVPRRSTRNSVFPRTFEDYVVEGKVKYGLEKVVNYSHLSGPNFCFATMLTKSSEPKTFFEASSDSNWITAMNDEIEALHRNNTWDLVGLPSNRKTIGCKWIYKIKYKSSREIERYKARLVAKGYSQREGVDFLKHFIQL
ncbi:uncharacterized protein LOC143624107 [Bidens hawaiensis]|uniref:uncharacterized protein LOC143624107 n=1 Tax=Bidens hawaiensis TaxID=980011 RepID=UPI00404A4165